MFLRLCINITLILSLNQMMAQGDSQPEKVDSPYRSEYNPWFKFGTFQRGYKDRNLRPVLDSLEAKPRKLWTRKDSLTFAQVTKQTGNLDLSAYYYDNLNLKYIVDSAYWWDRLVIHYVHHEFNTCLRVIREAEPGLVEHSKLWFLKKMCDANLRKLKDEKWFKKESVLQWKVDSTLINMDKNSPEFREKVIVPLENLSFILELLIRHIYEEDEVIARTCLEMGWIVKAYISPTQAYIAMSLGRNYDNWDKEILKNIKEVKAIIMEKKYRIPIFRKNFPRIEYWRFDYEVLKEQIIYARQDTTPKTPPVLYKEEEKKDPTFNPGLILLVGLSIIFFSTLIFLRTRRK
ncbi:MAG: hypothetical protein IPM74_05805 [Crocinitomicaceae bacterium]|nr:hypothetical protein [Crocinitomicaceae bacterium]